NNLRKPMPAGSGGFVATDDDGLADSLRAYRDRMPARGAVSRLGHRIESYLHARLLGPRTYWPLFWLHRAATGTYRTSPLRDQIASEMESTRYRVARHQYAAGLAWLERLPALAAHRRDCGRRYLEALGGLSDVETPAAAGGDPLYFFPVLVRDKPTLLRRARARSLEIVAWPVTTPIYPVEDPSVLGSYGYELGSCPVAEDVAGRLVGLPTDLRTRTGHLEAIIALVKEHGATV
ncbi:MAG: DegT/DnrJ/EryC1/StrS family aminotransferase, partial [Thermoanaerobaculia bacterium]